MSFIQSVMSVTSHNVYIRYVQYMYMYMYGVSYSLSYNSTYYRRIRGDLLRSECDSILILRSTGMCDARACARTGRRREGGPVAVQPETEEPQKWHRLIPSASSRGVLIAPTLGHTY